MLAMNMASNAQHYQLMEKAIIYLCDHFTEQPSLAEAAAHVGLSDYHFQRLFQQWAGVSPKQFLQYLTATYAKQRLQECKDTLSVTYESGLSSSSRLHDVLVKIYAATPAEVRAQGAGLNLIFGIHDTPFGRALIALSDRGICHLSFMDSSDDLAIQTLQDNWPFANLQPSQEITLESIKKIFHPDIAMTNLKVHLKGSPFQLKVWEALLRIPPAKLVTYEAIAQSLGQPRAYRAAATAIGKNPIGFLIPCHRVIRSNGIIGDYRWGSARKRMILGWEAVRESIPIDL